MARWFRAEVRKSLRRSFAFSENRFAFSEKSQLNGSATKCVLDVESHLANVD